MDLKNFRVNELFFVLFDIFDDILNSEWHQKKVDLLRQTLTNLSVDMLMFFSISIPRHVASSNLLQRSWDRMQTSKRPSSVVKWYCTLLVRLNYSLFHISTPNCCCIQNLYHITAAGGTQLGRRITYRCHQNFNATASLNTRLSRIKSVTSSMVPFSIPRLHFLRTLHFWMEDSCRTGMKLWGTVEKALSLRQFSTVVGWTTLYFSTLEVVWDYSKSIFVWLQIPIA